MDKEIQFGKGAIIEPQDDRNYIADEILGGNDEFDWEKGYDVEKDLGITIPIKNQGGSGSCVGQGWSYYAGVINSAEVGHYDEVSAKAIYSQIKLGLPQGGAYIIDGAKLLVNWGSLMESIIRSYETFYTQDISGPRLIINPPVEAFIKDKSWKTPEMDALAKTLQAKEYRTIVANRSMDLYAKAIRDYKGVVSGLNGQNNGSWSGNEPKPPTNIEWGHCIYFGKAGIDEKGKYIATPNSWGERAKDNLHPDGWQKIRADYFEAGHMFNPWTLTDKPNNIMSNVRVGKDENSPELSFIIPVSNPDAFKSMCKNYGIECPLKDDGVSVDWDKVKKEVSYKLI